MVQRIIWSAIFLISSMFALSNCTPATNNDPKKCTTNADCESGYRCVRQACAKYEEPNDPPKAVAGANQRKRLGVVIELDGSGSSDPNSHSLTYKWSFSKQPKDSKATLETPEQAKTTFKPDAEGLYIAQLVVTDEKGLKSAPSEVEIEIYGKSENGDPIANAGGDQTGCLNTTIQLDGSNSSDPDGDKLTYQWTLKTKPDGSNATLSDATAAKPTFDADKPGKYVLELVVNDGLEASPADTVSIDVIDECDLEPKLTKVDPTEAFTGTRLTVKLEGAGFSNFAIVLFKGVSLAANDVKVLNNGEIEANLNLQGITPGEHPIKVRNPNKKESNEVSITVKDLPTPTLTELSPSSGVSGAKMDVTVKGSGFVKDSEVLFDLVPLKTTFVSETELTFQLNLSQTLPGDYKVKVTNPGGRSSTEIVFKVIEAGEAPILNALNPPTGVTDTQIPFSVHGVGFSPAAVIVFDGKAIKSNRIRRDEIQADPQLDLTGMAEGTYKVWVRNADGKESNKEDFTVEGKDPTPILDRILPFFVYLDDPYNKLAVYGLKFRAGLKLKIGNTEISGADISFKSSTYFEANVDTTKGTWASGDLMATVINPNNKSSNTFKLTVTYRVPSVSSITPNGWTTGCDVDVEVYGSNFVPKSQVKFGTLTFTTTSTTTPLTFVNDQLLKLSLKQGALNAGTHQVQVVNGPQATSPATSFVITSHTSIPKPEIRESRPASARADTKVDILLYYNSPNYFWQGAVVLLDGKRQKTTCQVSGNYCSSLGAELDLTGLSTGVHQLTVENPCGKVSDTFSFYVDDPPEPYISAIAPPFARPGEKKKLVFKGVNFSKNAKINWAGTDIPTLYKSDTELQSQNDVDFTTNKAGDTIDVYVSNGNNKKTATLKYPVLDANVSLYINSLSTFEFDRGQVHNGVSISGGGFTATSEVYFNGQKVTSTFTSQFQIVANGLDFTTLATGTYYIYVKDGNNQSNQFPVLAKPNKEPILNYTSPTLLYTGRPSTTLYIYGTHFCEPTSPTATTCKQNPLVKIIGPNNTDYSSSFTITRAYAYPNWTNGYVYGSLNSSTWTAGDYRVYFQLPTGEKSNFGLIVVKRPPPPAITSISPAGAKKGVSVQLYLQGSNFVAGATAQIGLQTFASSGSGTYLYVTVNTGSLAEGSHTLLVTNPDGQASNTINFTVYPQSLPPVIHYTSPDVGYTGYTSYLYAYGQNFSNPMKLYVNGTAVTNSFYSSTSYQYVRTTSTWVPPAGASSVTVQVEDATGVKSNIVTVPIMGGSGPFIRYISPDYRVSTTPSYTATFYIYGFGFDSTSTFTIDGVSYTPTYRSGTYMYRSSTTFTSYKQYNVQVKNTNGALSNTAIFSMAQSGTLTLTSAYTTAVVAGVDKYNPGQFYVSGSGFTTNSKIYLDGQALNTSFSTSSRLYVNETLDFSNATQAQLSHFEVRDGTKTSNTRYIRVETGASRLNRARFTSIDPYVASQNKQITLIGTGSYLYSNYNGFFEIEVAGNNISKTYPLNYNSSTGKWEFTINTTGWPLGVYNVYVVNKATQEKSGGTGIVVIK